MCFDSHFQNGINALRLVRLRLNPAAPRTERVATHDDVIPLRNPIKLSNGEVITALPVKAGQVCHRLRRSDEDTSDWLSRCSFFLLP